MWKRRAARRVTGLVQAARSSYDRVSSAEKLSNEVVAGGMPIALRFGVVTKEEKRNRSNYGNSVYLL
jgi:hypothetical protein